MGITTFITIRYMIKRFSYILLLVFTSCLRTDDPEDFFLKEIYYNDLQEKIHALDDVAGETPWLTLVDIRDNGAYDAGHIPYAENIEMKFFIDSSGYLVNQGKAITQRLDPSIPVIVYSSATDSMTYYAAKAINRLGYDRVWYYEKGVEDWQWVHGDYLCMEYNGFMKWYTNHYPFDTLHVLIDVNPPQWFSGNQVIGGHIPGAVNLPAEKLINGDIRLSDEILYDTAEIIFYDASGVTFTAKQSLNIIRDEGFFKLFLFENGYNAWIDNGGEIIGN